MNLVVLPLALSSSRKVVKKPDVSSSVRPNLANSCSVSVLSLYVRQTICGTPLSTVPNNLASRVVLEAIKSVNFGSGIAASAAAFLSITMDEPKVAPVLDNCVNASTLESISLANSLATGPMPSISPMPALIASSKLQPQGEVNISINNGSDSIAVNPGESLLSALSALSDNRYSALDVNIL